ncbi:SubName: Full=Uncharacterized protein {ECO:0000313/EMBL:CCA74589.1} [Serendipita indica DSM 11827]|nr:SubName: Full=Uncharacterized protein {ECO:0000313/EMBL:CCA74589.1} [Serendipita indica DSM 11827]
MHRFGAAVDDDAANAVVSGLDAQGGGTWLGVNRHGRIAMMRLDSTNITEELLQRRSLSRGHLVSDFLLSDPAKESMQEYIDRLLTIGSQEGAESERDYAGFNLVLISFSTYDSPDTNLDRKPQIALVTNSGASGVLSARWMSQDDICLGGMSNGIDGKTMQYWTKIEEGKQSCVVSSISQTWQRTISWRASLGFSLCIHRNHLKKETTFEPQSASIRST